MYAPGEAYKDGGERRRATDPIWSQHVYEISSVSIPTNADYEYDKYTIAAKGPVLYHLSDPAGQSSKIPEVPAVRRSFVREELQVVRGTPSNPSEPQGSSKPQKPQKRGGRASQRSSTD